MAVSYNKLWKLLIDKNTMTKLRRDEEVSLAILGKICVALDTNIGDIVDFVPQNTRN